MAEADSRAMPGQRLAATLVVGARIPTLHTSIGNSLGWLCVGAAVWLAWATRRLTAHAVVHIG